MAPIGGVRMGNAGLRGVFPRASSDAPRANDGTSGAWEARRYPDRLCPDLVTRWRDARVDDAYAHEVDLESPPA